MIDNGFSTSSNSNDEIFGKRVSFEITWKTVMNFKLENTRAISRELFCTLAVIYKNNNFYYVS